jgi:hypothetical protein
MCYLSMELLIDEMCRFEEPKYCDRSWGTIDLGNMRLVSDGDELTS